MSQHYKGSKLGIKIIYHSYRLFGHNAIAWLVNLIALFYAFVSREKIKQMQSYYNAVGLKANFATYFHHIRAFSWTIFDRFTASEDTTKFIVERENVASLEPLKHEGGIVLFSHFGNWAQAYKTFSTFDGTLNIVFADALEQELKEIEQKYSTNNTKVNIIDMNNPIQGAIEIANALSRDEIVVMMSDRSKGEHNNIALKFLGTICNFNKAPFDVARMRNKPLLGLSVVRLGDNHTKAIYSDTLRIDTTLPKNERIGAIAQEYANYLEKVVQAYPYQWYNFYDFFTKGNQN